MSLIVLVGGVRSGKSSAASSMAAERGKPVYVVAGGSESDEEMLRRIGKHREERPACHEVIEPAHPAAWVSDVPEQACLVLDCLGSLIARIVMGVLGDAEEVSEEGEEEGERLVDDLVAALIARGGDTIVVANEVGHGIVPAFASGRLFRDLIGRANRRLVEAADGAWYVVAGRCIDLTCLPVAPMWPDRTGSSTEVCE